MSETLDRLVTSAGAALTRLRRRVAADHGVSATGLEVLGALLGAEADGASAASTSLRDLAARVRVAPATLTAVLDGLERAGDVRRLREPADRRVVRVAVTESGRERHREARSAVDRALREVLPSADEEVLRRRLTAILHAARDP